MVKKCSSVVKKGGTKRKIPMEKIANKQALAVAYTKRTSGLYSKVSQVCLLKGDQIAVLAAPPSSESNVSFYSFGHPSVDAVVSAYLSGQPLGPVPSETNNQMRGEVAVCMEQKGLGLGFWWEEPIPETYQDLADATKSMWKLMTDLQGLGADQVIHELQGDHHQEIQYEDLKFNDVDEALNLQNQSTLGSTPDDYLNTIVFSDNPEEQDQIQAIFYTFGVTDQPAESNDQEMSCDSDFVAYLESFCSEVEESAKSPLDVLTKETTNPNIDVEEESTACCVTDNPAENFDVGCSTNNQDMYLAQSIDDIEFGTYMECLLWDGSTEHESIQSLLVNRDSASQFVDNASMMEILGWLPL